MNRHFFKNYKEVNGCWEYQGARDKHGYGTRRIGSRTANKNYFVHRLVYEFYNNESPQVVRHTCDNPSCINPEHLVSGTHIDNMKDMKERGRRLGKGGLKRTEHPRTKFTEEDIANIKQRIASGETCQEISKDYNVARTTIGAIKSGQNWV